MPSHPVRIPEGTLSQLRVVSAVYGRTPGEVLSEAFNEYLDHHREDLRHQFELTQKYVLSGDADTLLELTRPARERRAKKTAARVKALRDR